MGKFEDLTGKKFGRLTVLGQCGRNPSNKILWFCVCDCGNTTSTTTQRLRSGHTQSCGCYNKDRIAEYFTKHGGTHTRLFRIWGSMKTRCYNPKSKAYHHYGGRGIIIWLKEHEGVITLPESDPQHMSRNVAMSCALAEVWRQGRRYQRDQDHAALAELAGMGQARKAVTEAAV